MKRYKLQILISLSESQAFSSHAIQINEQVTIETDQFIDVCNVISEIKKLTEKAKP